MNVGGISCSLPKASDCVNHELNSYGIWGVVRQ